MDYKTEIINLVKSVDADWLLEIIYRAIVNVLKP